MNPNNLTVVFFIEDYYQEKLLLLNPVINSLPVLAAYSKLSPKYFSGQVLKTEGENFQQALPDIFKNIKGEWIIYLKPEEKLPGFNNFPISNLPFYFLKIRYFMNKGSDRDDLINYEKRVFNKTAIYIEDFNHLLTEDYFPDITINNYSQGFPEITRLKLDRLTKNSQGLKMSPDITLFLIKNKYLGLNQISLFLNNLKNEDKKKPEILGISCEAAELFLENKLFQEAKDILLIAVNDFSNSVTLYFLLGKLCFLIGDYQQAVNFLEKCLELAKTGTYYRLSPIPSGFYQYQAAYLTGNCFLKLNVLPKARELFEMSLGFRPDFTEALKALTEVENTLKATGALPDELNFACQSCGNCCRYQYINITGTDIKAITDNRPDLIIDDFVTTIAKPDKINRMKLSSIDSFISEDRSEKILVLKKKENKMECVFLAEDNSCTIHAFKPLVCKTWPFISRTADNKIIWANHNREFIKKYCKHKIIEGANNPEALQETLDKFSNSFDNYTQLIRKWNRQFFEKPEFSSLNDYKFFEFLMDSEKDESISQLNNLNNIIELLKGNKEIKVITSQPFLSVYFSNSEKYLFIGIYLDDSMPGSFMEPARLKNLKNKLKADNYFYSSVPASTHNFMINGNILVLNVFPLSYINNTIHQDTKILYNPADIKIKKLSAPELVDIELKRIYRTFENLLKKTDNFIKQNDFHNANETLHYILNPLIYSLLAWLNAKTFTFLEIPFLEKKASGLCDIILRIPEYKLNMPDQLKFMEELKSVFSELSSKYNKDG